MKKPAMVPRAFGPIRQLGYIVEDLDSTVKAWSTQLGVGPWTLIKNIELHATFQNQPSRPLIDIALSYRGDVQIELIQQKNGASSPYRDCIDKGHYGLHHTAFLCAHIDEDVKRAEASGLRVVCDIRQPAGGGRYVYLQSAILGENTYIEFLEATPQMLDMFAQGVPAAAAWDGSGQPYEIDFALMSKS